MEFIVIIVLIIFGLGMLVFLHYRSKRVQQSKLVETLGNACGVMSLIVALCVGYLEFGPSKSITSSSYIEVTCTAPPSQAKGETEQRKRWLTKEAAENNCRSKLGLAIESNIRVEIKQVNGELDSKDIRLKANVALQLSEIVDGKFLPDGSYQMKMKAPRPVV